MQMIFPRTTKSSLLYSHTSPQSCTETGLCVVCPIQRWYYGTILSLRYWANRSRCSGRSESTTRSPSQWGSQGSASRPFKKKSPPCGISSHSLKKATSDFSGCANQWTLAVSIRAASSLCKSSGISVWIVAEMDNTH